MGLLLRKTLPGGAQIALWHITETEDELSNILSGHSDGGVDGVKNAALRRQKLAVLALIRTLCPEQYRLAHRSDGSPYLYIYSDADNRDADTEIDTDEARTEIVTENDNNDARTETDNNDARTETVTETDNDNAVPQISISHTGDYAAVMLSPVARPGIDIELVSRDFTAVGRKALSAREAAALDALPPKERNLRLGLVWCAKEAVYKSVGAEAADFAGRIEILDFPPAGDVENPAEAEAAARDCGEDPLHSGTGTPSSCCVENPAEAEVAVRDCGEDPLRRGTGTPSSCGVENPAEEAGAGEGPEAQGRMTALFSGESGKPQKLTLCYLILHGVILVWTAD